MQISTKNAFSVGSTKREAYFLQVLWDGMVRLNDEVAEIEKNRAQEDKTMFEAYGLKPLAYCSSNFGSGPNDTVITNNFIWYACSAWCFLQLFDCAFRPADAYKDRFSAMLKWRKKVAAHTAWADPRGDDSTQS